MSKLLSVCLITKNEENFLEDCLKSVTNVADEIIIVDTGSTDRTIEIAKKYNADIHFFEWISDFAAARNESLKYATGDYVLTIDADERLTNPDLLIEALTKIRANPQANICVMTVKQFNTAENNKNKVSSYQNVVRLFDNRKGFYWKGKVHEQLVATGYTLINTDIELFHLGYDLPQKEAHNKAMRNLLILQKMREEKNKDDNPTYIHYQIIKTLFALHDIETALKEYNTLDKEKINSHLHAELLNLFATYYFDKNEKEKGKEYAYKSLEILPENIFANRLLGNYFFDNKEYENAIPYYVALLKSILEPTETNKLTLNQYIPLDIVYHRIGECYFILTDYVNAMDYFSKGIKINPKNPLLLVGMANIAFKNRQFEQAKQVLQIALQHNPSHNEINDFIAECDKYINDNSCSNEKEINKNEYYFSNIIPENETTLKNIKSNNLLSLCMIVKNEEKMLTECLKSVKNIVDEIIIVDTGSTDKTIEIAKQYGAKIYHFDWINDFSAARNESLKYSTSKWILYLDADERLTYSSQNEIRTLINTASDEIGAYYVTIESDHRQLDGSAEKHRGAYPRLFRNFGYPNIKFMGRVHEQISPSIIAMKKLTLASDLIIEHLGYNLPEEIMNKKVNRNYKLLLEHVKEEPTNGYAWFQLGQTLGHMELYKEAEDATRFAIQCNDLKGAVLASATASLSQFCGRKKEFQEALYWANETLKIMPNQLYGLSLKAHSLLYLNRKKEAEQTFLQALDYTKNIEKHPKIGFDIDISEKMLLDGLKKSRE